MARINLLTRHSGESYGAVLQTYATCKILESLGHCVTIINLVEKKRIKRYYSIHNFRSIVKYFNFWRFKFKYYPPMTKLMTHIEANKIPKADYTVVGSDQVWNSQITKENKLSFFLDFTNDIKISLASSFGKSSWEESEAYTAKVKQCLSDFAAVSVREKEGVDMCREVFEIEASCIIDPTIAWGTYDDFIKKNPKNQIACFVLKVNNPLFFQVADSLAQKTKYEVLILDYYSGEKYNILSNHEKSPIRWLNEIYNSKIIITDSFHGVAFSLLFKKSFFAICADEKKFVRISSLLRKVGMEDRIISDMDDFNQRINKLLVPPDFTSAESVLRAESNSYYQFVKRNIHE